jgi:protein-tyrosine phosphatase
MAAHQDQRLDASNVATRLWVGGMPPFDRDLPDFDLLVLCAQEIQPSEVAFHGKVLRCPLPDGALNHQELARAVLSAKAVGDALLKGQRVLVTCAMGLNRSALVAALAMARATKMTAPEIVGRIRQRRSANALYNTYFQELIRRLVRR